MATSIFFPLKIVASVLTIVVVILPGLLIHYLFYIPYLACLWAFLILKYGRNVRDKVTWISGGINRIQSHIPWCYLHFVLEFDAGTFSLERFQEQVHTVLPGSYRKIIKKHLGTPVFISQDDFDFKSHFKIVHLAREDFQTEGVFNPGQYRESIRTIVENIPHLNENGPQWEFFVITPKDVSNKKCPTTVIYHVHHGYGDIISNYVFLASLADTHISQVPFAVNPLQEPKKDKKHPSNFFLLGWGILQMIPIAFKTALLRKVYKPEKPPRVNFDMTEMDFSILREIHKSSGLGNSSILTTAASEAWKKFYCQSTSHISCTHARLPRTLEPGNNSDFSLLMAEEDFGNPFERIRYVEKQTKGHEYTRMAAWFCIQYFPLFFLNFEGFFSSPSNLLTTGYTPFTTKTISMAGCELKNFYWSGMFSLNYAAFVTYGDKLYVSTNSPVVGMTKDETRRFTRLVVDEIRRMHQYTLRVKNSDVVLTL